MTGSWIQKLARKRQMVLFAAALLLPYVILLVLTARLATQDRELDRDQSSYRLRQVAREAREDLLAVLDKHRQMETLAPLRPGERYRNAETVFVGWVEDDRLVLPWEGNTNSRKARERVREERFVGEIRACDRAEQPGGESARC